MADTPALDFLMGLVNRDPQAVKTAAAAPQETNAVLDLFKGVAESPARFLIPGLGPASLAGDIGGRALGAFQAVEHTAAPLAFPDRVGMLPWDRYAPVKDVVQGLTGDTGAQRRTLEHLQSLGSVPAVAAEITNMGMPLAPGGFNPVEGLTRAAGYLQGPARPVEWSPLEHARYAVDSLQRQWERTPESFMAEKAVASAPLNPVNYVGWGIPGRLAEGVTNPVLRNALLGAQRGETGFNEAVGQVVPAALDFARQFPPIDRALTEVPRSVHRGFQQRVGTARTYMAGEIAQHPDIAEFGGNLWRGMALRPTVDEATQQLIASGLDADTIGHWGSQASQMKDFLRAQAAVDQKFKPNAAEPLDIAGLRAAAEQRAGLTPAESDALVAEARDRITKPAGWETSADISTAIQEGQRAQLATEGVTGTDAAIRLRDDPALDAQRRAGVLAFAQDLYGDVFPATLGRGGEGQQAAVLARFQKAGGVVPGAEVTASPGAGATAAPGGLPQGLSQQELDLLVKKYNINPEVLGGAPVAEVAPKGARIIQPEPAGPMWRSPEERAAYYAAQDARIAQAGAAPPTRDSVIDEITRTGRVTADQQDLLRQFAAQRPAVPEAAPAGTSLPLEGVPPAAPPGGAPPSPAAPLAEDAALAAARARMQASPPVPPPAPSPVSQLPGLYSEMSPRNAAGIISDEPMLRGVYASPSADLALGQGTNRGVTVEFGDLGRIWAEADRSKPANAVIEQQLGHAPEWVIEGTQPGTTDTVLRRLTIDPTRVADDTGVLILEERLRRAGWQRQGLPDGRTEWTNPRAEAAPAPGRPPVPEAGPPAVAPGAAPPPAGGAPQSLDQAFQVGQQVTFTPMDFAPASGNVTTPLTGVVRRFVRDPIAGSGELNMIVDVGGAGTRGERVVGWLEEPHAAGGAPPEYLYHTTAGPWDRGPLRPNPPDKYAEGPVVWLTRGAPWQEIQGRGDVLRIDPSKLDPALLSESPRFGYPMYRGAIPPEAITVEPRSVPEMPPGAAGEAARGTPATPLTGAPAVPPAAETLPAAPGLPGPAALPAQGVPEAVADIPAVARDAYSRLQIAHGNLPEEEQILGIRPRDAGLTAAEAKSLVRLGVADSSGKGAAMRLTPKEPTPPPPATPDLPPMGGGEMTDPERMAQQAAGFDQIVRMSKDRPVLEQMRAAAPKLVEDYEAFNAAAQKLKAKTGLESLREIADSTDEALATQARQARTILRRTFNVDPLSAKEDDVMAGQLFANEADAMHIVFRTPAQFVQFADNAMNVWRQVALLTPRFNLRNLVDQTMRQMIYAGQLGLDHPLNPFGAKDPESFWQVFNKSWQDSLAPGAEQAWKGQATRFQENVFGWQTPQDIVHTGGGTQLETGRGLARLTSGPLGGLGRAVRFNTAVMQRFESATRASAYWAGVDRATPGALPQFEQALDDALGMKSADVMTQVDQRAGKFNTVDYEQWLTKAGVTPEERGAAESALGDFRTALDKAGRDFSFKLYFNYGKVTHADEWARRILGFHVYASRNIPFALETLATHPGLMNLIGEYRQSAKERAKAGGYEKNPKIAGTFRLPTSPGQALEMAFFGPAGEAWLDPSGYASLLEQSMKLADDSPEPKDTPWLGRVLNNIERLGFTPGPWISMPLHALGQYGAEQPQSLFPQEGIVEGAAQWGTGRPFEFPWKTLQRLRLPGQRQPNDPAMRVRLRLEEMAFEQNPDYAAAHPTAPWAPAYTQAMVEGPGNPLWDQASRELGRMRLAESTLRTSGIPLAYQTTSGRLINEAGAGLPEVTADSGGIRHPLLPMVPRENYQPGQPYETPEMHSNRLYQRALAGNPYAAPDRPMFRRNVGEPGGGGASAQSALRTAIGHDYDTADPARKAALMASPTTRPYVLDHIAEGIKFRMVKP